LREKINSLGKEALYLDSFEKIKKFLINNCEDGDLLITMGAGDVVIIGDELVK
jgi:UDP-N-acetylmuramate--alanine ligase